MPVELVAIVIPTVTAELLESFKNAVILGDTAEDVTLISQTLGQSKPRGIVLDVKQIPPAITHVDDTHLIVVTRVPTAIIRALTEGEKKKALYAGLEGSRVVRLRVCGDYIGIGGVSSLEHFAANPDDWEWTDPEVMYVINDELDDSPLGRLGPEASRKAFPDLAF